jgi:hypothetical protein
MTKLSISNPNVTKKYSPSSFSHSWLKKILIWYFLTKSSKTLRKPEHLMFTISEFLNYIKPYKSIQDLIRINFFSPM